MTPAPAAGLYIHVPFCLRKCDYCDFYSIDDLTPIPGFLDALIAEMGLYRGCFRQFDTLYLGGGTPSLLTPLQISRIIDASRETFPLSPDAEITMEVNPGAATAEHLAGFRGAGVNRLNVGVQSFKDRNLRFLGRIHSAAAAVSTLRMARRAGFGNLGLDLIYGLPDQSPNAWRADLEQALDVEPDHLSCYLLTWEAGTPLYDRWRRGRCQPPPDSRTAALFQLTADLLAERGFVQYEVSNFARSPERCSRHNRKYWSLAPYLGLGPAAHSFDPERRERRWNHGSLERYLADLATGDAPVADREILDRDQQMMEILYLGLRTAAGIDLVDFRRRFGEGFEARFGRLADRLAAEGWLRLTPRRCRPTRRGMGYADGMAARFCRYL